MYRKFSARERRYYYLRNVIFSPASGGRVNPSRVIIVVKMHGMIRLKPEFFQTVLSVVQAIYMYFEIWNCLVVVQKFLRKEN